MALRRSRVALGRPARAASRPLRPSCRPADVLGAGRQVLDDARRLRSQQCRARARFAPASSPSRRAQAAAAPKIAAGRRDVPAAGVVAGRHRVADAGRRHRRRARTRASRPRRTSCRWSASARIGGSTGAVRMDDGRHGACRRIRARCLATALTSAACRMSSRSGCPITTASGLPDRGRSTSISCGTATISPPAEARADEIEDRAFRLARDRRQERSAKRDCAMNRAERGGGRVPAVDACASSCCTSLVQHAHAFRRRRCRPSVPCMKSGGSACQIADQLADVLGLCRSWAMPCSARMTRRASSSLPPSAAMRAVSRRRRRSVSISAGIDAGHAHALFDAAQGHGLGEVHQRGVDRAADGEVRRGIAPAHADDVDDGALRLDQMRPGFARQSRRPP